MGADNRDEQTLDPMKEIEAMRRVAEALGVLDSEATARVLRWALERYGVPQNSLSRGSAIEPDAAPTPADRVDAYEQLPDFYAACSPHTDAEKALVLGYWLQYREGNPDFDTQRANTELKHLGYPIGNITRAFDQLESTSPRLVIQVRKLGSTKQARKRMKLTIEGKKAVEGMLGGH